MERIDEYKDLLTTQLIKQWDYDTSVPNIQVSSNDASVANGSSMKIYTDANNDDIKLQTLSIKIPKDGFYYIEDGQPYGPDDITWDSPYYSTAMQGGAFRLPNGNTLITDCDSADIEEITESGSVVWSYSQSGNNANIARAQKYAIDHFDVVDDGIAGDINGDGILNILDIVSLVNLILTGNYEASGDINGDDLLNILDIVSLVNLILGN